MWLNVQPAPDESSAEAAGGLKGLPRLKVGLGSGPVRALPLRCIPTSFAAKTLPLRCVSTAFAAKKAPLPCVLVMQAFRLPPNLTR